MCGILVLFCIGVLATAGGLGAGGILIPYIMIFFGLPVFECVPIANAFGLISSATRFVVNYRQKHPNPLHALNGRLPLDYEMVQLTMALVYIGTFFGVYISTLASELFLTLTLVGVMGLVIYKTTQNAIHKYKEENKEREIMARPIEMSDLKNQDSESLLNKRLPNWSPELMAIIKDESQHFPFIRTFKLVFTMFMLFITSKMLGNKYTKKPFVPV
jgi:hypothetical protein